VRTEYWLVWGGGGGGYPSGCTPLPPLCVARHARNGQRKRVSRSTATQRGTSPTKYYFVWDERRRSNARTTTRTRASHVHGDMK
jgi:hypothetical protein